MGKDPLMPHRTMPFYVLLRYSAIGVDCRSLSFSIANNHGEGEITTSMTFMFQAVGPGKLFVRNYLLIHLEDKMSLGGEYCYTTY